MQMNLDCEILVIGAGPAGCSAAMMAHSLGIHVQIVEQHLIGGQVREISKISNFIAGPASGLELAEIFASNLAACSIPIIREKVIAVKDVTDCWEVVLVSGRTLRTKVIIAATGTRELGLTEHSLINNVDTNHEDSFIYTSAIDLLMSKDVVVIGSDRVIVTLASSKGEALRNARIRVLALPDKRYVVEGLIDSLPFEFILVSQIIAVNKQSPHEYSIEYLGDDRIRKVLHAEVVLTNLGKAPNSELFVSHMKFDDDGYLIPNDYRRRERSKSIYPVGDVAHKAFQRISTAIGDGAYAVLDYFYSRENLYQ